MNDFDNNIENLFNKDANIVAPPIDINNANFKIVDAKASIAQPKFSIDENIRRVLGLNKNHVFIECVGHILSSHKEINKIICESEEVLSFPRIRERLIDKVGEYTKFQQAVWVDDLLNGLKQAGVHGINEIKVDDRPITVSEVKKLIGLIIDIIRLT